MCGHIMISYTVGQHGVLCDVKLKNSTRYPSATTRSRPACVRENECATICVIRFRQNWYTTSALISVREMSLERSLKAKFHYAVWFEAGSTLVADKLRTS